MIVSVSPGIVFEDKRSYQTYQLNASGYESLRRQLPLQMEAEAEAAAGASANDLGGAKNVSGNGCNTFSFEDEAHPLLL